MIRHHDRHLGDGRLLRPDRQALHISGGVGIGGVLEPLQAGPVIIEDDCFIGARSEVAEGVIVREGAVLSMGVFLGASTKIIDRATGEVLRRGGAGLCGGRARARCPALAGRRARPGLSAPSSSSGWTSGPAPRPPSTNCCGIDIGQQTKTAAPLRPARVAVSSRELLDEAGCGSTGFICHRFDGRINPRQPFVDRARRAAAGDAGHLIAKPHPGRTAGLRSSTSRCSGSGNLALCAPARAGPAICRSGVPASFFPAPP